MSTLTFNHQSPIIIGSLSVHFTTSTPSPMITIKNSLILNLNFLLLKFRFVKHTPGFTELNLSVIIAILNIIQIDCITTDNV